MKMTIRLGHRNTSVRIRDDLLALWYILCFPDEEMTYSKVHREVRKFISHCLTRYETPRKKKVDQCLGKPIENQNREDQENRGEDFRVKKGQDENLRSVLRNTPIVKNSVLESKTRLTDYINSCIVQEVLDRPERVKYRKCLKLLSETMFNSASIDIQDLAEHRENSEVQQ